jgi:hypothetical protein
MKILSSVVAAIVCIAPLAHAADSFEDRMKAAMQAVQDKRSAGKDAFFGELEKQARGLLKDFPDKGDPYEMLAFRRELLELEQGILLLCTTEQHRSSEAIELR